MGFSHLGKKGEATMVDISRKARVRRRASAFARVSLKAATVELIRSNLMKKGDVLSVARIAGISAANILYIVDEASGVDEKVFEAMEGNMAAGAKMVLTSNPTRTVGTFFDAFHSKRQFWHCMTTSSEESPNVTGERHIPGLAGKEWIAEKKVEWGIDSPIYHIRVAGKFPGQSTNAAIGLALAEEARHRFAKTDAEGALRIGIDVARYGDDETVIWPVRGAKALKPLVLMNKKGHEIAGEALDLIDKLKRSHAEPVAVKVDEIGLGASPLDFLSVMERAKDAGVTVRAVNVSKNSEKPDKYHDLRTQLCFDLKDWLEAGGAIPDDEKLVQEMISPTYHFDVKGRKQVDTKEVEKKTLGRSPDRRNALELAIYEARPRRSIGAGHINM